MNIKFLSIISGLAAGLFVAATLAFGGESIKFGPVVSGGGGGVVGFGNFAAMESHEITHSFGTANTGDMWWLEGQATAVCSSDGGGITDLSCTWDGTNWTPTGVAASGLTNPLGAEMEAAGFSMQQVGVITLLEQAAADSDVANEVQIWANTANPGELFFTSGDDGIDIRLGHHPIAAGDFATDAVDSDDIAAGAIDFAHMSDNSVGSEHYDDGSIDVEHLSDNSVDKASMADDSVGDNEIDWGELVDIAAQGQVINDSHTHTVDRLGDASAAGAVQMATDAQLQQAWTWNWPDVETATGTGLALKFEFDSTSGSGTSRGLVLTRQDGNGTSAMDSILFIANNEESAAVTSAIAIGSAGGGITTAIDMSGPNITTGIALGGSAITVSGQTIAATDLEELATIGGVTIETNDWLLVSQLDGGDPAINCADCTSYPINKLGDSLGTGSIVFGPGGAEHPQTWTWTWPVVEVADMDALTLNFQHASTSGANIQNGLVLARINGSGDRIFESLLHLKNLDATAVTQAIEVTTSSANGIVTALQVSNSNITNAIAIGQNDVLIDGNPLLYTEFERLIGLDDVLVDLDDTPIWTGLHTFDDVVIDGILDTGTLETFGVSDQTPDVGTGSFFKTNMTQASIIDFDGAILAGQFITVEQAGATTYDCTSSGLQCGSVDIDTEINDFTSWLYDGSDWHLIAFMDQSTDMGTDSGLVKTNIQGWDADSFKLGASPPALTITGATFPRDTLGFDDSSDESMTVQVAMPAAYDDSSDPTITIDWHAISTTNDTCWCVSTVTLPDASAQTGLSATDTDCTSTLVDSTTLFMNKTIITIDGADFVAGQTSAINIFRDANESTCSAGQDDMTGDAEFHTAVLSFQVSE